MRLVSVVAAAALLIGGCSGDDEVLPPDAAVAADAPGTPDGGPDAETTDAGPQPDAIPCVIFGGGVREDMPGMPCPSLPPLVDVSVRALVDGVEVDQSASLADG